MSTLAADSITFRDAGPADALCLGVLSTQVFLDTYATRGIRRAIADEVLAEHAVPVYEALLAHLQASVHVAERDGHLVGFAVLHHGERDALVPAEQAAELARLYVQRPFTGRGIGRDLLRRAEKTAAARGAELLWLTAWQGNARALHFYPRCGYEHLGNTVHRIGAEEFPNLLFAKRVRHVATAEPGPDAPPHAIIRP